MPHFWAGSSNFGFSYYSITGEKKDAVTIKPAANGFDTDIQQITGDNVQDTASQETEKSPGYELVFTIAGMVSALRLLKKKS